MAHGIGMSDAATAYAAAPPLDTTVVRATVRELVARDGVQPVARALGMSRHAILGLAGPGPVRAGTVALAHLRLATLERA